MGTHVAVLGIDGIGKRTIVSALEERCRTAGRAVKRVSWQRSLAEMAERRDDHLDVFPDSELHRLWLDVFRLYFGEATVEGHPLNLPDSYREAVNRGIVDHLRTLPIQGLRASSLLATGWVELAGFTVQHYHVLRPLVEEGYVVLQESLGYKNLLKSLFTAEYIDPGVAEAVQAARAFVREFFGNVLAPDVGLYLVGDPERALAQRRPENIGVFESFRAAGGDPKDSFLALQRRCAAEFDEFAKAYNWIRIDISHVSPATMSHVVDELTYAVLSIENEGRTTPNIVSEGTDNEL